MHNNKQKSTTFVQLSSWQVVLFMTSVSFTQSDHNQSKVEFGHYKCQSWIEKKEKKYNTEYVHDESSKVLLL